MNAESYIIAVFSEKCSYAEIFGDFEQLLTLKRIIDNDERIKNMEMFYEE